MFDVALQSAAPAWATFVGASRSAIDWVVAPPLPSGMRTEPFVIRTDTRSGRIAVGERVPGARLPKHCPELHVNTDASFCIGRSVHRVADAADAGAFWQSLGEYLVNQHFAARRGSWPVGRWFSHGPRAADLQEQAERAAASIGLEAEYAACLENDEGFIADLVVGDDGGLKPGAFCRRGCRDATDGDMALRDCAHRYTLLQIVTAERSRRVAQDDYYGGLRLQGMTCCGRVSGCPLETDGERA